MTVSKLRLNINREELYVENSRLYRAEKLIIIDGLERLLNGEIKYDIGNI